MCCLSVSIWICLLFQQVYTVPWGFLHRSTTTTENSFAGEWSGESTRKVLNNDYYTTPRSDSWGFNTLNFEERDNKKEEGSSGSGLFNSFFGGSNKNEINCTESDDRDTDFREKDKKREDTHKKDRDSTTENPWGSITPSTAYPNWPRNTFAAGREEVMDRQGERGSKRSEAEKWCTAFEDECLNRTKLTSRIVGGTPATSLTFMALIGFGGSKIVWLCGGSLISRRFVLSAAHCAFDGRGSPAKIARLGELDLSRSDETRLQEKRIIDKILHPRFKQPPLYHDIALFKLESDVIFNGWVAPLCLQTETDLTIKRATASGWGRIEFAMATSDRLLKVEVSIFNETECRQLNIGNGTSTLPKGLDPDTMICAGEREGGKDSCTGDSGGPLVINTGKCTQTQIGITSAGLNCGLPNTPGLYTRVSYYIQWIESIVGS